MKVLLFLTHKVQSHGRNTRDSSPFPTPDAEYSCRRWSQAGPGPQRRTKPAVWPSSGSRTVLLSSPVCWPGAVLHLQEGLGRAIVFLEGDCQQRSLSSILSHFQSHTLLGPHLVLSLARAQGLICSLFKASPLPLFIYSPVSVWVENLLVLCSDKGPLALHNFFPLYLQN